MVSESVLAVRNTVKSPRLPDKRETGIAFVPESSMKVNSVELNPRIIISESTKNSFAETSSQKRPQGTNFKGLAVSFG